MVAVIVSVGDAGALGIVANGGEWGGKEQGEDSPGSGFNLGIRAAKADKRVSKPGLGAFFHTGIAGVGFAFGINGGFEVVEGKEGVIIQAIGVVNAVHCEADIAGVGDGDGGVGFGLEAGEFLLEVGDLRFPLFGVGGWTGLVRGFKAALRCGAGFFQVAVREDGERQGFHFAALGSDELGQAGEDAGRVILPGGCVMTFILFYDNHCGASFHFMVLICKNSFILV